MTCVSRYFLSVFEIACCDKTFVEVDLNSLLYSCLCIVSMRLDQHASSPTVYHSNCLGHQCWQPVICLAQVLVKKFDHLNYFGHITGNSSCDD